MMIPKCYQAPSSEAPSSYAMSAPFNHLLTTNETPSPEDVHNLKSYLSYPKNRIVEIRRRIEALHIELAALNVERDTMAERYLIPQHEAILSPVRRLPTSVLQTIFVYGVLAAQSIIETHSVIIILSRVCRRWRTIVLQTPALHSSALGMTTRRNTVWRESIGMVDKHGRTRPRVQPADVVYAGQPRNISIANQDRGMSFGSVENFSVQASSTSTTSPVLTPIVFTCPPMKKSPPQQSGKHTPPPPPYQPSQAKLSTPNSMAPAQRGLAFLPLFNQIASQRRINVEYKADFSGPPHAGRWTVTCVVNGIAKGTGSGGNKQVAKEEAARAAYHNMGF